MHFVKAKTILSPTNRINLYRGCTHNCIYCDSRSACYQMNHQFENVEVKENAIELLEERLSRKRKKCMIHFGAMSDPYIPIEKDLQYTRRALELVYKYDFGVCIQTKSDLILRDLDIIKKINDNTKCVVEMTLTTYDDDLCRKLERSVCPTSRRIEVLKKLHEMRVPTVVWIAPILPFINDTEENIRGLLNYCIEAKVYGILCFGMALTLREGNREYYYQYLDKLFPNLKDAYIKTYGSSYIVASTNNHKLMNLIHAVCKENNIVYDDKQIFDYLNTYEQKNKPIQLSISDLFDN